MKARMTTKRKWRIAAIVLANVAVGVLVVASFACRLAHDNEASDRLSAAACRGDIHGMEAVLAQGCSVDGSSDENDTTALMSAAGAGQLKSVNFLLAHGAAVNHRDYYHAWTALYYTDSAAIAKCLMAHGASPRAIDLPIDWSTTIFKWAKAGDQQVVLLLLQHGANPTAKDIVDGRTPAEVAKAAGHADVAKILRTAEADWKKTH